MQDTIREDCFKRLNYIEGHLGGIRRMIQGDKYCVDILKQTFAVRKAI
ncbi:MAG: metal-sensing transcriptional repressor, partial [Dehalococcoidia bacterium]